MDFGRVASAQLAAINFTLPEEPEWNSGMLKGEAVNHPKIYVGCPRWGTKEWVGKIYPKRTKDAQFLIEYIKQYNTIELNATYHTLYHADAIKKWAEKAKGADFLFCPKMYRGISHDGLLTNNQQLTAAFLDGIAAFGDHLGPVFLQLSDALGPERKEELFYYLGSLPPGFSFFLELRHPQWFQPPHFAGVLAHLHQSGIGLLITDVAGRRDCCHMHLTGPKTFIRFAANNLHPTDYTRIDDWVGRIKHWLQNGLPELFFIIHMPDEGFSPELSIYFIDKLNAACGLQLKKPVMVQPSLFD